MSKNSTYIGPFGALGNLVSLRVQVPNDHILPQNLYYNYYYTNPKYLIIGYMDPYVGVEQDLGFTE